MDIGPWFFSSVPEHTIVNARLNITSHCNKVQVKMEMDPGGGVGWECREVGWVGVVCHVPHMKSIHK